MFDAIIALVISGWLSSPPASLADIAAREAVRRKATAAAVISLKADDRMANASSAPSAAPASEDKVLPGEDAVGDPIPPAAAGSSASAAPPPATNAESRNEAWWRQEALRLKNAAGTTRTLADAMQSRINALQADVVNRDNPVQQSQLREQLNRALTELVRLQAQVKTDEKHYAAFIDEARRQNVPTGWVR